MCAILRALYKFFFFRFSFLILILAPILFFPLFFTLLVLWAFLLPQDREGFVSAISFSPLSQLPPPPGRSSNGGGPFLSPFSFSKHLSKSWFLLSLHIVLNQQRSYLSPLPSFISRFPFPLIPCVYFRCLFPVCFLVAHSLPWGGSVSTPPLFQSLVVLPPSAFFTYSPLGRFINLSFRTYPHEFPRRDHSV